MNMIVIKYDNRDVYPESRYNNTVANTGASSSQQHWATSHGAVDREIEWRIPDHIHVPSDDYLTVVDNNFTVLHVY